MSSAAVTTMKAMQVHDFVMDFEALKGNDKLMSMNEQVPKPILKKGQIMIQVQACSLSPGDVIMVHGNLVFLHEAHPFVPGMDVCGVVVDSNGSKNFHNGDVVVAANGLKATGGMAEFMVVAEGEAVLKPSRVSVDQAAASSSAITARNAVMAHVRQGDRVLILGGSGGVGSTAIQIAKTHAKASFVATTSTQTDFCRNLGAEKVIDYRQDIWWTYDWPEKFDVIVDCVGGGNFYGRADKVLKPGKQGGRFVAITGDDTKPDCRTIWKAIKFFANMPCRPLYTKLKSTSLPNYILVMPSDMQTGRKQVLDWMQEGTLTIPLDKESPLPFTADGVRDAFSKVASCCIHCFFITFFTTSFLQTSLRLAV
jgi:NADPH:quinone reductase-like Zn-dependent oxidoreductase